MVCWAVIPARLGSVRLPEKPLADLGGLPLVAHVWRRVVSTGRFDRVIVATDHDRVARVIEAEGGEVRRTGACRSGTHRVAEVAHATEVDRVVNVQGDGPMVSDAALDAVLRGLDRAPISTVCAPYLGDPQERARVKVLVQEGLAVRFDRSPMTGAFEHVGLYGFTAAALQRAAATVPGDLEQRAWMRAGLQIAVEHIAHAPPAIDTMEQLTALRTRFDAGLEALPLHPAGNMYDQVAPS